MRAVVLAKPGVPPVLEVQDIPTPSPGRGEVLVRVAAAGFCHHDLLAMSGVLRRGVKPAVVLGHEISGVVAQVGPGVTSRRPGDRVVSILTNACGQCDRCRSGLEHRCRSGEGIGHARNGGFAEYVLVNEFSLVPVPNTVNLRDAALLACPIGVVYQAIHQVARLQPGETMLVTGAGGGLGIHGVQVGVAAGARVLAATSSADKLDFLERIAGVEAIEHDPLDFSEMALALTDDEGVDVIIDTVGSPLFASTWRSLAQYGRLVLLGEVAGRPVQLNLAEVIFRDARLLGASGVSRATVRQVAELVSQGKLQPVISQTLPLEEVAQAFRLVASRKVLGRVVLTV